MPGRALATAIVFCLAAIVSAGQGPIRSGARTVAVYTTVTESGGRLVPDLTRDDFEIYDNGKLQKITVFASDVQPITVVMLLDRSGSVRSNFTLVEAAAEQFVERLMPGDKARIGSFATRVQVDPRDFTADKGELIGILRTELQPEGPTPLWNAVSVGITALLHQDGRRVILVFTDGVDRPMNDSSHNVSLKDAMKRAEQEDVMVYAIGLTGQTPFFGGGMGGRRGGFGRGGYGRGAPTDRNQEPDKGLAEISAQTGGGYFELTSANDLAKTFGRVVDELHRQYALGFEPIALDGKTHKLEVRVKRAGMIARARRSYVASRDR
jgi:Ca-activated chloride channel family protein